MADAVLVLLTLLWGTTFSLVKEALVGTSAGVFVALRFTLALAVLGAVWLVTRARITPGLWRDGLRLGLAMLGGFGLQTEGLRYTTAAHSAFITGSSVLLVPFIARVQYRRRIAASGWAGAALALWGILLLTRPWSAETGGDLKLGDLLTFGCALANAYLILFTSDVSARHGLVPLTAVEVAVTLAGALVAVALEPIRVTPGAPLAGVVAFTGIFMTAGAMLVMNWAQRRTSAVRAALIYSIEPVAAAIFAHFYAGDTLGPFDWVGGGLVLAGVVTGEAGAAWAASRGPRTVPADGGP
jgi:drug/metabolite transporter (DMT)-like permease